MRPLPITIQTGTGHYPKTEAATCQRHSQQVNYFIRRKRTIPFVAPTWGPRKHHLNERIPQTRSWLLGEYLLSGMPGKDTLFGDADTNVPIDSSPQHESTQSGLIHAITLIQHSRQTMIRHQFSAFRICERCSPSQAVTSCIQRIILLGSRSCVIQRGIIKKRTWEIFHKFKYLRNYAVHYPRHDHSVYDFEKA